MPRAIAVGSPERVAVEEILWHRDDYGECMITLPGKVDGHRVRVG